LLFILEILLTGTGAFYFNSKIKTVGSKTYCWLPSKFAPDGTNAFPEGPVAWRRRLLHCFGSEKPRIGRVSLLTEEQGINKESL
jgi:hypothetical protein